MAIITESQPLYSTLSLLGILLHFIFSSEGTLSKHTTHDIVHHDSPLSPFYNPSITHFDCLQKAFRRSLVRANCFKYSATGKTQAPMIPGGGEYLMKISTGTQPVEVIGIADTGSDLIWTQCLPCIKCYSQTIPLFDPDQSKSYHTIPCNSNFCDQRDLNNAQCDLNTTKCLYRYSYLDGSHTTGNLAFDTLTLGIKNPISLPNTVFGCAHDTACIFYESGSGIIGLGRGKLSLISQLPGSKKFSHCLIPTTINSTSKISFGNDAVITGSEVVTTPLVTNGIDNTSYYITLEAFSVGKERIDFTYVGAIEGNVVVDSGTTLTYLPLSVLNRL